MATRFAGVLAFALQIFRMARRKQSSSATKVSWTALPQPSSARIVSSNWSRTPASQLRETRLFLQRRLGVVEKVWSRWAPAHGPHRFRRLDASETNHKRTPQSELSLYGALRLRGTCRHSNPLDESCGGPTPTQALPTSQRGGRTHRRQFGRGRNSGPKVHSIPPPRGVVLAHANGQSAIANTVRFATRSPQLRLPSHFVLRESQITVAQFCAGSQVLIDTARCDTKHRDRQPRWG